MSESSKERHPNRKQVDSRLVVDEDEIALLTFSPEEGHLLLLYGMRTPIKISARQATILMTRLMDDKPEPIIRDISPLYGEVMEWVERWYPGMTGRMDQKYRQELRSILRRYSLSEEASQ